MGNGKKGAAGTLVPGPVHTLTISPGLVVGGEHFDRLIGAVRVSQSDFNVDAHNMYGCS